MSWRDEPKRWYSVSKCGCAHTSTNHPWVVRQTSLPGECVHVCDDHKPKANPMTDITLEQRAATVPPTTAVTFVPAFSEASRMLGMSAANGNHDGVVYWQGIVEQFEAAAKEALRLSAGADSARLDALEALVDSQPDKALLLHHGQHGINGRYAGLGLSNTGRTLRQAIDAAAPRHETGEGS